ncbi:TetR family transcriptional regulator [Mycobacterium lentiflavum]|uniref:TetR family transcriptional regulator n=1 Tax=Mycobacterium lentiflavum TaxID=141349 RepID=A0A0E4H0R0_MYCLN|nr:TetR/AcrR family transcriptional regulator C-terminal domain-containing protein [Mycobacterium lentiflavum]CQD20163.1 TetR family transcriptional regulator [Mycobacterium lentiflavum]
MTEPAESGRQRRPGRPALLTSERVARAAFELVDTEGAAALTIARLARELGVGPMTIYGYAESKDAILAMLPDLLLENLPALDMRRSWDAALEKVFVAIYRRFLDHRHVTQAIAELPVFGHAQAEIIEQVLRCLDQAGFSAGQAFVLQRTLATYTLGFALFAIVETAAGAERPRSAWTHQLDKSEFPYLTRVSGRMGGEVTEHQYLAGLRRILGR